MAYNGLVFCSRDSSCTRSHGRGNTLFETGLIFGRLYSRQIPKSLPKIIDENTVADASKLNKLKVIQAMMFDREYGTLLDNIYKQKGQTDA